MATLIETLLNNPRRPFVKQNPMDPMETPDQPQKSKRFRWIMGGLLTLGVLVAIAGLTAPRLIRSYRDPMSGDWHSLTNLGWSLQTYAGENDGRFPDRLEDLDAHLRRWTYFPGLAPNDPPDTILVASSKPFSKADGTHMVGDGPHRMVLSLGGRRFLLKEADYQACIKEQQHLRGLDRMLRRQFLN